MRLISTAAFLVLACASSVQAQYDYLKMAAVYDSDLAASSQRTTEQYASACATMQLGLASRYDAVRLRIWANTASSNDYMFSGLYNTGRNRSASGCSEYGTGVKSQAAGNASIGQGNYQDAIDELSLAVGDFQSSTADYSAALTAFVSASKVPN